MGSAIKKSCGLAYLDVRSNHSNAIIFIHGNSHSKMTFTHQLSDERFSLFRTIAVDLSGHGDSDKLNEYSLTAMAKTLCDFIADLKLKNYILVGHSLGGHVLTQALTQLTPRALVLYGTPPLKKPLSLEGFLPNPKTAPLNLDHSTQNELEILAAEFGYQNSDKEIFIHDYLKTDPTFRTTLLPSVVQGHYQDETALLEKFEGKTLGIVLNRDFIVNNDYIRREYSNLSIDIVEVDSAHCPHVEVAQSFNSIISRFAQDVFSFKDEKMAQTLSKDEAVIINE